MIDLDVAGSGAGADLEFDHIAVVARSLKAGAEYNRDTPG